MGDARVPDASSDLERLPREPAADRLTSLMLSANNLISTMNVAPILARWADMGIAAATFRAGRALASSLGLEIGCIRREHPVPA